MPESPRWLIKVGREEEGRWILGRLRGEDADGLAEAEFQDIRNICELERKTASANSYIAMFFGWKSGKLHTGRRVQLVVWLQILQEWIGIAGITIYGPRIFTIAGIAPKDILWVSGLNDITYMVSGLSIDLWKWSTKSELVFNAYLRLHTRSYRTSVDTLLGIRWTGNMHVLRRRPCSSYSQSSGKR